MSLAVDGSNYGGELTPDIVRCWRESGVNMYICGVDLGHIPLARQQLGMAVQGGLAIEVYRFCYWGQAPVLSLQRVADAIQGLPVGRIWLDFEDEDASENPDQVCTWIKDCLDVADTIWGYDRVGIYTAAWWWNPYTGNTTRFADRALWVAQYDGLANLDFFVPFGGWQSCVMKQYTNTIDLCGYSVDKNYYEEDNDSMDEETKNKVARIALLQRWAGMIQSGDDTFENRVYQEMKYIRQLAGRPV